MRDRLKFLVRDTAVFGTATAFNKAIAIITFPILSRRLSVDQYGTFDFLGSAVALLSTAIIFGQDSGVARLFYTHEDSQSRKQLISQSLALQVTIILIVLPVLWFRSAPIRDSLVQDPHADSLIRLALVQSAFLVLTNFSQNILKWTFQRHQFIFLTVGSTTTSMLALVAATLCADSQIVGLFAIGVATQIVFGIIGLWFIRHWLCIPTGVGLLADTVRFAIPYGAIGVAATLIPTMQRALVGANLGQHELGLFAAGAKAAMLVSLPIQAFQTAWGPFYMSVVKGAKAADTYNYVLKAFCIIVFCAVLLLGAIAGPLLSLVASSRYDGASIVVFAIAFGLAIEATGWITSIGIAVSTKSYLNYFGYLAHTITTLGAAYLLVNSMGILGVAWAAAIGHATKTVIETWLAQRAYPIEWDYVDVVGLAALTLVFGLVAAIVTPSMGAQSGALVSGVGAITVLFTGVMRLFTPEARHTIAVVLRSALGKS